jgi:hypothetical protein
MIKTTFLHFCDDIWKKSGLDNVLGHSFRIGGAVELLIAGVSPEVVAAVGGWTSLAFLIYWRRFEEILPNHIRRAYTEDQVNRLKHILDDFQASNHISNAALEQALSNIDLTELVSN